MRLTTISTAVGFLCAMTAAVHAFPTTLNANASSTDMCPRSQYACPDCPEGTECVYPDSGGCPGAGIPVCKATNCFGFMCLIRAFPCPEECPYSCKYNGPACCPFIGAPVCDTSCQDTHCPPEKPCPDDCPDACVYPEDDPCCPHMGEPVCPHKPTQESPADAVKKYIHDLKRRKVLEDVPWSASSASNWFYQSAVPSSASAYEHAASPLPLPVMPRPVQEVREHSHKSKSKKNWFYQPSHDHPPPPQSSHWVYQPPADGLPIPTTFSKDPHQTTTQTHQLSQSLPTRSSWFYQTISTRSSWLYQPEPSNRPGHCADVTCPSLDYHHHSTWGACTTKHVHEDDCCPSLLCAGEAMPTTSHKTAAAEDPTPAMALATSEEAVLCADYIIPCPDECPEKCVYPTNAACPYQHQPACPPTQPIVETTCIETERFVAPPSSATPPPSPTTWSDEDYEDDDIWGSLWHGHYHHSSEHPAESSPVVCPMIMYLCPPECPEDCIRPNVPCPFAERATCPDHHHHPHRDSKHKLSAASVKEDDTNEDIEERKERSILQDKEKEEDEEDKEKGSEVDSKRALDSHAVCASLGLGTLPPARLPFDGAVPLQHLDKRDQDCQDVRCPPAPMTCDEACDHCCLTSDDCCVQPICVHA